MNIRKVWAGRYEIDPGGFNRYTVLNTEFGWHIFAGYTCDDDRWVNGAYDTKREAIEVITRIEANDKMREDISSLLSA